MMSVRGSTDPYGPVVHRPARDTLWERVSPSADGQPISVSGLVGASLSLGACRLLVPRDGDLAPPDP
jgi:hypothetical protein